MLTFGKFPTVSVYVKYSVVKAGVDCQQLVSLAQQKDLKQLNSKVQS